MARLVRTFSGRNGSGPISVSGVKVGDRLIVRAFDNGNATIALAEIVMVDDEVFQSDGGNYNGLTYIVLIDRDVLIP